MQLLGRSSLLLHLHRAKTRLFRSKSMTCFSSVVLTWSVLASCEIPLQELGGVGRVGGRYELLSDSKPTGVFVEAFLRFVCAAEPSSNHMLPFTSEHSTFASRSESFAASISSPQLSQTPGVLSSQEKRFLIFTELVLEQLNALQRENDRLLKAHESAIQQAQQAKQREAAAVKVMIINIVMMLKMV